MGYSGLIYAAIVAAWAAFLVPRWVRRNEEVERARESDSARGVRVLHRTGTAMHAPHRGVPLVEDGGSGPRVDDAAPRAPDALGDVYAEAARRRRRMLSVLVLATVLTVAASLLGSVPGWAPVLPILLTFAFLLMARRAAVEQARRRRVEARRRPAHVAEHAESAATDDPTADDTAASFGERRLVLPVSAEAAEDPDGWQPVPVPLPTYLTKPKAPRVARTIDLSKPGSWTSGRLDPAGSVEMPRREPDERRTSVSGSADADASNDSSDEQYPDQRDEEPPEHRRAVGD